MTEAKSLHTNYIIMVNRWYYDDIILLLLLKWNYGGLSVSILNL